MISSNFFLRRFDFIKMLTNYKVNKLVVTYCLSHRISISWSNLLLESCLYLMPQLHDKFMICQTFFVINKAETRIFAKKKVGWNHLKYHHLSLNYALYVFLRSIKKIYRHYFIHLSFRLYYKHLSFEVLLFPRFNCIFEYSIGVCITNFHTRRITLIRDFESRRVWFTDLFIIEVTSFLWLIVSCLSEWNIMTRHRSPRSIVVYVKKWNNRYQKRFDSHYDW